jgi:FdhD protein
VNKQITSIQITKYSEKESKSLTDFVAIEEPLEISIAYTENDLIRFKIISVTMRTPGNDEALALGFLFTENIISTKTEIKKIETKGNNKICVFIDGNFSIQLQNMERNFYTTSSCGVCGKASIEAIHTLQANTFYPKELQVSHTIICSLPYKLLLNQSAFQNTGGIHAAVLFDDLGNQKAIFEDVGRHNALDKLVGDQYLQQQIPLNKHILLLSGRASFELLQKAAMANIQLVCSIGAPSSLAVQLAEDLDISLVGFLKEKSFNIYNGEHRICF